MCNETIKNNIDEVTGKVNNSLMKKTKAQLVEIILRKDEVERECRTEISNLNKKIKGYDADIESMAEQSIEDKSIIDKQACMLIEKENLIEDMKSQFDISAIEVAEVNKSLYLYKYYARAFGITCAVLTVILICKLFVF